MTRATNAGSALSAISYVPASRKAPVDVGLILRLKDRGLGVQNIALQTGFSMEDVRKALNPAANDDRPSAPKAIARAERPATGGTPPRVLTERDHSVLAKVENGQISQATAGRLLNCTSKTVRRLLDRRADERVVA